MGNQKRMPLKELRERIHTFRGKQKFEDDIIRLERRIKTYVI